MLGFKLIHVSKRGPSITRQYKHNGNHKRLMIWSYTRPIKHSPTLTWRRSLWLLLRIMMRNFNNFLCSDTSDTSRVLYRHLAELCVDGIWGSLRRFFRVAHDWHMTVERDIVHMRYFLPVPCLVPLQTLIHVYLTHWGRVTHICVSKLTIIGSDNGLSPDRSQAIILTNDGLLLIGSLGTNFREILIDILTFSFKKMRLNVSSAKRRPFCLGLNVLSTEGSTVE